ncbi:MAG TPA: LuxR C-terminal-related transcriptional regulator [Ktedonobacteraceae bacterium]|jgi:DNA-binding NarL/FixJ family response regulator
MQINVMASSPEQSEGRQEAWARKLRALMVRIQALQMLVRAEDDGDDDGEHRDNAEDEAALDRELLFQGLLELERMAGEVLYEVQEADGDLLLGELPGGSLSEALSQLVDTTAEKLSLSSRVAFSGWERTLSDYLSRLLYRIAQETLARVSTHEGARRLRFSLDYRRGEVVMTIEDDGVPGAEEQLLNGETDEDGASLLPFLAANQHENHGAQSMTSQMTRRLRGIVESLGGSLSVNSGVEQGVQVQVHVPVRLHERGEHPHTDTSAAPTPPQSRETAAKIKVLIVDGQTVSRAGLRRLLESYPDLEIVGEAADSVQAASETAELLPQIVLLDAQLPEDQTLETLRQVRQLNGDIRVLLLAGREDETLLYEALRAGAGGYISKDIAPDELAQAVRGVARGDVLIQPQLAARLLTRSGASERAGGTLQESLTAREREVLQLLARGLRNKEIASRLFVSERTVNFHLANIYAKLHVSGRTEALSKALAQGLFKV